MHLGVIEMLKILKPQIVVVYGAMPRDVFCELPSESKFLRFDNWTKEKRLEKWAKFFTKKKMGVWNSPILNASLVREKKYIPIDD